MCNYLTDCFYRLMSGKRLVKTHTLRAISVNSLQECQEACIHERGFSCRSISYRYMPSSGYSYPVSYYSSWPFYRHGNENENDNFYRRWVTASYLVTTCSLGPCRVATRNLTLLRTTITTTFRERLTVKLLVLLHLEVSLMLRGGGLRDLVTRWGAFLRNYVVDISFFYSVKFSDSLRNWTGMLRRNLFF